MKAITALVLALLPVLPACGGGGGNPIIVIGGLIGAAGCTVTGLDDYTTLIEAIQAELEKSPVPAVLDIDIVADGKSIQMSGTITEMEGDLSDGLGVGDIARVVITSLSIDGTVTGSGDILSNFDFTTDPSNVDSYPFGSIEFTTTTSGDTLQGVISLEGTSVAAVSAQLNGSSAGDFNVNLETFEAIFF